MKLFRIVMAVSAVSSLPSSAGSVDEDAAKLCAVATKMRTDPKVKPATVLQQTALRFTEANPAPALLRLMDSLAGIPRTQLYGAWRDGLKKLGVKNPECPDLDALWKPSTPK